MISKGSSFLRDSKINGENVILQSKKAARELYLAALGCLGDPLFIRYILLSADFYWDDEVYEALWLQFAESAHE